MPDVQGRALEEALQAGPPVTEYRVVNKTHRSSTRDRIDHEAAEPTWMAGVSIPS